MRGVLMHRDTFRGKWNKAKAALASPEVFPANDLHDGFLAGELPNVVTEEGAPTIAEIQAITRDRFRKVAGTTMSAQDGTWRIDRLNPDARYDIIMRKDTYNDLIVANVTPVAAPVLRVKHITVTNGQLDVDLPLNFYGGEGEITASVTDGALPLTLTLHENHLVSSEVNAQAGEYSATLTLTSGRYTVTQELTVTVRSEPIFISVTGVEDGYENEATIDPIAVTVTGGRKPYIITVDDLPEGLTYSDGEISGTLDEALSDTPLVSFAIRVEDADGMVRKWRRSVAVGGDPYWSNVITLFHFEDEIKNEKTQATYATPSGWVYEAPPLGFGKGLKRPYNNNSYTQTNINADFSYGEDFTIEAIFNVPVSKGGNGYEWMIGTRGLGSNTDGWYLSYYHTPSSMPPSIQFGMTGISGAVYHPISTPFAARVAVTRKDGVIKMFVDGVNVSTYTGTDSNNGVTSSLNLTFGDYSRHNSARQECIIDELRITKGVARYTEDFDPPTEPFFNFGK